MALSGSNWPPDPMASVVVVDVDVPEVSDEPTMLLVVRRRRTGCLCMVVGLLFVGCWVCVSVAGSPGDQCVRVTVMWKRGGKWLCLWSC